MRTSGYAWKAPVKAVDITRPVGTDLFQLQF